MVFDMKFSIETKQKKKKPRREGEKMRIIISKSIKMKLNRKRVINVHGDMSNKKIACDLDNFK